SFDAPFDEIAHGKADVRFICIHASVVQPVTRSGHVGPYLHFNAAYSRPGAPALVIGFPLGRAKEACPFRGPRRESEMRTLTKAAPKRVSQEPRSPSTISTHSLEALRSARFSSPRVFSEIAPPWKKNSSFVPANGPAKNSRSIF